MEIESFVQWIISLVSDYLYPGIFTASLLETIFPPIPSEAIFPLAGYLVAKNNWPFLNVIGLGITGALGSTIGAIIIYFISYKIGRERLAKYLKYVRVKEEHLKRVDNWFSRYGDKVILFGRLVPGVREIISIPAGFLKMKMFKFVVFTFIGSSIWGVILSLVGYYFEITSVQIFG